MVYVKLLAWVTLAGSIAWVICEPGFKSCLTLVGAISALISLFLIKKKDSPAAQQQTVSEGSVGVQATGNVTIGTLHREGDSAK